MEADERKIKAAEIAGRIVEAWGAEIKCHVPKEIDQEKIPGTIFENLYDSVYKKIRE